MTSWIAQMFLTLTNRCKQSRTSEGTVPKSSPMGSIFELANNMRNNFSPCGIQRSRSLGSNDPLVAGLPLGTAQIRKKPTMWSMRYKWKYCCARDKRTCDLKLDQPRQKKIATTYFPPFISILLHGWPVICRQSPILTGGAVHVRRGTSVAL